MAAIKKNQHYVPQFWIRGFVGPDNRIYRWDGKTIGPVSSRKVMSIDWLYAVFDHRWRPSDVLENAISTLEARDARLFRRLSDPAYHPTSDDRERLCYCLALQACRHPDVMNRGRRLAQAFAAFVAAAHSFKDSNEFATQAARFNIDKLDAKLIYRTMLSRTVDELATELQEIHGLSPQDPKLPIQEALRARVPIYNSIRIMDVTLLDAPGGENFILGDTPLPQSELSGGFRVPLSKSIAVEGRPHRGATTPLKRRRATVTEIRAINQEQWDRTSKIVIGPDPATLQRVH